MKRDIALCAVVALASIAPASGGAQSSASRTPTIQERLGYPANARLLILHADDFGMSHSVNRAIVEALEHGWVSSASIMVPCPWFAEVARWAKAHPDADLGIHLVLNSEWTTLRWGPVSGRDAVPSLLDPQGYLPLETDALSQRAKPQDVERELRAQIEFARASGVNITHLDSHMAALFQTEMLYGIYHNLGQSFALPQLIERIGERGGEQAPAWAAQAREDALVDRVLGMAPGVAAAQWFDEYKKMLTPLAPGVYELIVHLGYDDDEMRGATSDHPNWGAAWRQSDLDLVKSAEFQDFLKQQQFHLITWRELGKARVRSAPSRSLKLSQNYRNSRDVLTAGHQVLMNNLSDELLDREDLAVLDPELSTFTGATPVLLEGKDLGTELRGAIAYARERLDRAPQSKACVAICGYSQDLGGSLPRRLLRDGAGVPASARRGGRISVPAAGR